MGATMQQWALTQLLRHWFGLSPMIFSVNQKSRTFPTDPVLIFSGTENSRSFPTVDNDIERNSFTDVAIVETTESKATKSKIKTEVEHYGSLPDLADDVELDSYTQIFKSCGRSQKAHAIIFCVVGCLIIHLPTKLTF